MSAPIETALSMYRDRELRWERDHPGEKWPHPSFEDDLFDHMKTGFVMANQLFFVMAKSVNLQIPGNIYTAPAWLVQFAVGPLMALLGAMPVRLPYLAFARHDEDRMRIYSTERLLRIVNRFKKNSKPHDSPPVTVT